MDELAKWMGTSWRELGLIALSTVGVYLLIITYTRVFGLRSFSKMSGFDFAATVAVGSILATTAVSQTPSLAQGAAALLTLYAAQRLIAFLRERTDWVPKVVDNNPVLLVDGSQVHDSALRATGITRNDLRAKLREANVLHWGQVRAVILESTGDISVLHGDADGPALEDDLLSGVTRYE